MSWGVGPWGVGSPWGTGSEAPPPTIIAVGTPHGETAPSGVVAREGGDVITVIGEHFSDPMTIEIMLGAQVVGECYIALPRYDIRRNRVYAGTPPQPDGTYGIRITTVGGTSPIFLNALTYGLFSEEMKVEVVRKNMSAKWKTGRRLLSNPKLKT